MARYSETVGGLFTHDASNNNIAYFTVNGSPNGINVPVTNTSKTIAILKAAVYEIVADADVFFKAFPINTASPAAATTTATDQNGKFLNGVVYIKKLEAGQKITVITATTANLRLVPVEFK